MLMRLLRLNMTTSRITLKKYINQDKDPISHIRVRGPINRDKDTNPVRAIREIKVIKEIKDITIREVIKETREDIKVRAIREIKAISDKVTKDMETVRIKVIKVPAIRITAIRDTNVIRDMVIKDIRGMVVSTDRIIIALKDFREIRELTATSAREETLSSHRGLSR